MTNTRPEGLMSDIRAHARDLAGDGISTAWFETLYAQATVPWARRARRNAAMLAVASRSASWQGAPDPIQTIFRKMRVTW
jgi:hypothetical protein